MKRVYTIGHSTQTREEFLGKLKAHGITCIAEVRSTPYSKFAGEYNAELLKLFLYGNGIAYVYLGKEFGARREDRSLYDEDGKLNFEKAVLSDEFKQGVARLERGIKKGYNIALKDSSPIAQFPVSTADSCGFSCSSVSMAFRPDHGYTLPYKPSPGKCPLLRAFA